VCVCVCVCVCVHVRAHPRRACPPSLGGGLACAVESAAWMPWYSRNLTCRMHTACKTATFTADSSLLLDRAWPSRSLKFTPARDAGAARLWAEPPGRPRLRRHGRRNLAVRPGAARPRRRSRRDSSRARAVLCGGAFGQRRRLGRGAGGGGGWGGGGGGGGAAAGGAAAAAGGGGHAARRGAAAGAGARRGAPGRRRRAAGGGAGARRVRGGRQVRWGPPGSIAARNGG
jgi:hypothetical protein